jgi:nucleotide-binding universal stress UspA family protein
LADRKVRSVTGVILVRDLRELGGPGHVDYDSFDDDGRFHRVLVRIDSYGRARNALGLAVRMGRTTGAQLRFVHPRIWDPVGPRRTGRFYCETSEEATVALAEVVARAWACNIEASGVVVDAERPRTAAAILTEASAWDADVILLTRRTPRFVNFGFWDRVSRQVTRGAPCPVLVVHQGQA